MLSINQHDLVKAFKLVYMVDVDQAVPFNFHKTKLLIKLLIGDENVRDLIEEVSASEDLSLWKEIAFLRHMYKRLKLNEDVPSVSA